MTVDVRRFAREAGASISAVCRALDLPRSIVHAQENACLSARAVDTVELDAEIREVLDDNGKRYGSPRVHEEMRASASRPGCVLSASPPGIKG